MFTVLNRKTLLNRYIFLSLLGGLTACGGSGQDSGDGGASARNDIVFSGLAIDGYIARATVFIDSNNNGTRDAWEPYAFTDNDGYYSYNPNTDTNYCASNATPQQQQYCLNATVEYSNVVIRIDSGYDVITGEPFLGQMSRRIDGENESERENTIISPITSLLSNVESNNDREALLTSLSITEEDLDVDYLNDSGSVNAPLLNTALKIHKVVAVLSDRLTDTYTEIGEDFGTPNDASSTVYPNLAEQIINAGTSLDMALADESTLVSALDAAENSLREVYERKEFTLPTDMGNISNPGAFERVAEVASEFSAVVNTLIDVNNTGFNLDDATGGTRALESLVIKTVNEGSNNDDSIDNVINFFDTEQNSNKTLVESLIASLSMEGADIQSLAGNDFSGNDFDGEEEIIGASSLGSNVQAFTQVGGLQIRISDLDLGSAPNNVDDAEVEFYFAGEPNDVEGSFWACVKFIDDANASTGELGEGNTRGELVDGFWSLLGANEDGVESFSLLITLTFLGTTYQAIMKPAGTETIGEVSYAKLRFDNDGELNVWHSQNGFSEPVSIPTTNEGCQERLPSRVGL